jgi:hypothetical protein
MLPHLVKNAAGLTATLATSATLVGLAMTAGLSTSAMAGEVQTRTIEVSAVTGWNRRYEEPIHVFKDIGSFGFSTIRVRNPEGGRPTPITRDTPLSAPISTYFDITTGMPVLPSLEGFSFNADAPELNQTPVIISRDGDTRVAIRSHMEAGQMEVSSVGPSAPITLGEWMQAEGKLTIACEDGGENWLHIKMTGLVPKRHYSIWQWFRPSDLPDFPVIPGLAGGLGADIMSSAKGKGSYSVQTKECLPLSLDESSPAKAIMVIMHWDHQSNGSVPIAPLHPAQPRLPGDNAGVQLWWPIATQ